MKLVSCAQTASIAGCCTTKSQFVTGPAKLLSGMDRVSILRIASERKNNSAEAARSCKEASFISPKGSGLPTSVAGPSILPDSTTGPLNYFGCTASIRASNRLLFRNTWIVSTHRIASSWRTSSRDSRRKLRPFDATKRIIRPNGEVRYIRCVGVPIVENESLKKYVGSALDVTEQELVTQELRRREAYLAEAQRLSHTGQFRVET